MVKNTFVWENANVYFLLTDRFNNADTTNDFSFDRKQDGGKLRNFQGGDLEGITQKVQQGYFDELGVNVLWFSPVMEQIHGFVDEGTGNTYAYHGYWPRDWTSIDPNWGTKKDLKKLVKEAHQRGIRVMLDVIINHTGPVTPEDSQWPDTWVRTGPQCDYKTKESTISCTLVANLPDVKTESNEEVELPDFLIEKWKREGRYEQEVEELDEFFKRTNYPRAPRFYIIKWLSDLVRELGVDGFRVDTAKHTEASIWAELYREANAAFLAWKEENPAEVLDDNEFFMVGEVYNYAIGHGMDFPYDDGQTVNFFDNGFNSLINFSMKYDVTQSPQKVFERYSDMLNGTLKGKTVLNYLASHDDSGSFDRERNEAYWSATMLMLTPGQAQIYYGDETGRKLVVPDAVGDAQLRSFMNWDDLENDSTQALLEHWQLLGRFRKRHPAIGAGVHQTLLENPFSFSRTYVKGGMKDQVLVVMDYNGQSIPASGIFEEGEKVIDYYSGKNCTVKDGQLLFEDHSAKVILLEAE